MTALKVLQAAHSMTAPGEIVSLRVAAAAKTHFLSLGNLVRKSPMNGTILCANSVNRPTILDLPLRLPSLLRFPSWQISNAYVSA